MFKLRGFFVKSLCDGQAHLQNLLNVNSVTHSRTATAAVAVAERLLQGGSFYSTQQLARLHCHSRILTLTKRNNHLRSVPLSELKMACSSSSSSSESSPPRNRLAAEKSPYLLQHATNPVNWYPWGEEAFQRAKEENKPIFLSVGYSTCHWCHVMEHESFQDATIGRLLNQHFIPIKVDREERPDVDRVYMTFVQATTGSGGWPMSVWLTPDLRPILGGTYFPPDDRYYGRPGFMTVCQAVAQKWASQQSELEESGTLILDALMRGTSSAVSQSVGEFPVREVAHKCYDMLSRSYDEVFGGFGKAPKFPQPMNFTFLGRYHHSGLGKEDRKEAVQMMVHTLKMMAKGGVHDHIAQGFHRYSTDRMWHVPHFEKMLYDQAQLAVVYLDAYQLTKDPVLADTARDIFEYVNRNLSHKEGGFYSAEDADSLPTSTSKRKREGAFCVWTYEEIQELFKGRVAREKGGNEEHDITYADVFCHHYHVKEEGNVNPITDPHEELKKQNVLMVKGGVGDTAAEFGIPLETAESILAECRKVLFEKRLQRPKPHLDDKMISAWNGLMISGFARGGQVLHDPSLTARAVSAAKFLREHLYDLPKGVLLRSCYTSKEHGVEQVIQPIPGFVDDYAFVVQGLLDLYEATFDPCWLQWAEQLQQKQDELFWDADHGGYFSTVANDPSIVLRMKDDQDGAEPSSNSVSALNLLRLSAMLNQLELREQGLRIMSIFQKRLAEIPLALPGMVSAGLLSLMPPMQIIIKGSPDEEGVQRMLREVHSHFLPSKVLLVADGNRDNFLYQRLPVLESMERLEGKPTVYVCQNFTCSLPTNSVLELATLLSKDS